MKTSLKTLLGAAAAVALTATAAVSVAQDAPAGPPPGGFQGRGGPPPSPEMRAQMMSQRLGLRADQQPALQAFLAATQPPGGPGGRGERQELRNLTTPERLDRQLAELKTRADATKKFYAQLTPDQRITFDSMPMMGPEGRGGGRGGPGGPGGQGGRRGGPNQGFGGPPPQ